MIDPIKQIRGILADNQCDAFFSMDPPTNQYLTGFNGTTSGVIITDTDALFLCDFRYTEQAADQVKNCTIEEIAGSFTKRMGDYLKELGATKAAFHANIITVADHGKLQEAFTGSLVPLEGAAADLRMVKSPDEIERRREASALAEGVLADLLEDLDAATTESDLAARFVYEFQRRGATGPSFPPIVLFGARSSLPHGQPSDRVLEKGDIILLDFGCVLDGYCSDLTRTYVFGNIPGKWFEDLYHLILTAEQCALEAARPGMTGRDLDAAARNLIEEAGHGDHFGHGLGHGVGIEIHESPRLNRESDTVLEPGMVITIEPGVYLPGRGGVRIEDLAVITKDGCEVLSSTPTELRILS